MKETPFIVMLFIITFFVVILVLVLKAEKTKEATFREMEQNTAINYSRANEEDMNQRLSLLTANQDNTNNRVNAWITNMNELNTRLTTLENKPTALPIVNEYKASAYCLVEPVEGDVNYLLRCKNFLK